MTLQTITNILGPITLVGGAVLVLFSKVKTDNLADLKQRVEILENERDESRAQHIENQKAIANLEGQLSTYKEIPLRSIADSLEKLTLALNPDPATPAGKMITHITKEEHFEEKGKP